MPLPMKFFEQIFQNIKLPAKVASCIMKRKGHLYLWHNLLAKCLPKCQYLFIFINVFGFRTPNERLPLKVVPEPCVSQKLVQS